jgi:sigma-B regulation protein RsbU (phosphoserine phosphatase)
MKLSFENKSPRTIRIFFSLSYLIVFIFAAINASNILYFNAISNDQCAWRYIPNRDSTLLITDVVEGGVADNAGLKDGDILLKLDGKSYSSQFPVGWINAVNEVPRGGSMLYTVERDGKVFETRVEIIKVFNFVFLANLLFGICFLVVGHIVVMTRPEGIIQRAFAFMSLMLLMYFGFLQVYTLNQPGWYVIIIGSFFAVSRVLGPVVFINFFMSFPVYRKKQKTKRNLFIIFLISLVLYLLMFFNQFRLNLPAEWAPQVIVNIPAGFFIAGLIIFAYSYFKFVPAEKREPLKPILIASVISIASYLYVIYLNNSNQYIIFIKPVLLLPGLLLILLPVSFGYSIFKYRLMDTQLLIKKSIIYGTVTTTIAAIYLLLVFGAGSLLQDYLGHSENNALSLVALIVIAFVFEPLKKRVQNWVDKVFYREKYNYQKALLDFSRILPLQINLKQIVDSVVDTVSTTMHIEKIAGVLLDENNASTCFSRNIPQELCVYSREPQGIISLLESRKAPIDAASLIHEKYYYNVSDEELDKITRSGVQLIIPMVVKSNIIGFFSTGPKLSEKTYSQEDIDLLFTVANQAGIAIENARLYEKEKTLYKVQEEIKLASKIQSEWIPKSAPVIPGFDIAGKTIPAQVVGGDYFDFIEIDDNSHAFCIGDVSGKGLTAALLMANMQAVLRGQALANTDTSKCLEQTNKLVYINSTDEMFVTLFYGILDFKNRKLTYTNAGHNYPVLFSKSGKSERMLTEGGLALGVQKDFHYQKCSITFTKGDVLIMYTDGITDAFNLNGGQYGEHRLYEAMIRYLDNPAHEIIENILKDVDNFTNGTQVYDDMTLVVIKYL